jgi:dTDP-4-amino-4,6-dideoxygalactose transaminase
METPHTQLEVTAVRQPAIPAFSLTRQYETIEHEIHAAVNRVLGSQHFIGGPELEQFEVEAAQFLEVSAVVGCASGTDALWLALEAVGVGPGDTVLTTPFSFFASASSIVRCGATPIFADIDPATLNLSPESARSVLKSSASGAKAIVPVHLYGQCANMGAFGELGNEFNATILEDAAQAFGAKWRGRMAGSLGKVAAFSFYPTKNLGAYGDGGCVTTEDPDLAIQVRGFRNHGSRLRYYHEEFGWNSRLDALQSAILRVKLHHLPEWNNRRRAIASRYSAGFEAEGLTKAGSAKPDRQAPIALLAVNPEAFHIFHQYVVRAYRRDELRAFLSEAGIGTEIYYPLPLHLQEAFAYLGYGKGDFPEAERASSEVLALPMFPELREEEQQRVVAKVAEFYGYHPRTV